MNTIEIIYDQKSLMPYQQYVCLLTSSFKTNGNKYVRLSN